MQLKYKTLSHLMHFHIRVEQNFIYVMNTSLLLMDEF